MKCYLSRQVLTKISLVQNLLLHLWIYRWDFGRGINLGLLKIKLEIIFKIRPSFWLSSFNNWIFTLNFNFTLSSSARLFKPVVSSYTIRPKWKVNIKFKIWSWDIEKRKFKNKFTWFGVTTSCYYIFNYSLIFPSKRRIKHTKNGNVLFLSLI